MQKIEKVEPTSRLENTTKEVSYKVFGLKKRPNNSMSKLSLFDTKHKVHGLQVFAFSVLTINDEHTKPRFKRNRRG